MLTEIKAVKLTDPDGKFAIWTYCGLRAGVFPGLGDDSHYMMNLDGPRTNLGRKPYNATNNMFDAADRTASKDITRIVQ